MKQGWTTKSLAAVCEIRPPKSEASKKVMPSDLVSFLPMENLGIGVKYFQAKHSKPLSELIGSYTYFADGDVLLAKITPCFENGKLGIARDLENGIGFGSSEYIVFRPQKQLHPEWLYYFLSQESFRLNGAARMTGAVGHKRVSKEFIEESEIPVPPVEEQRRIVALLDEAFAGIAVAKANAEQNLKNARALFESHLNAIFTNQGPDWNYYALEELTHLSRGHNPPKSKFSAEPKPGYVRFYQIRDGSSENYAVYVPDSPQLHKMKADDIMMVAYRHVGRVFRGVEGAFNVALCKISNKRRDLLNDDYLYHIIPTPFVKGELLKRSERSLIPSMSIEHLKEIQIPVPPLKEQNELVKRIDISSKNSLELIRVYERKIAALEELKKALLHKAFSGEL
jgi:type I restriction enzyme S subunit